MSAQELTLLSTMVFVVAVLYSSVGHGGASGYLAAMVLLGQFAPAEMASTALLLNLFVAALSWQAFARAGFFSWKLTAQFLITSVPAAFIGGFFRVPPEYYAALLGVALVAAALRMIVLPRSGKAEFLRMPPYWAALLCGAGIGLISGMVGVGGGIFLSPLLILLRWVGPKHTAATSAAFIWINSLSGIAGRLAGGHFVLGLWVPFLGAAVLGGLLGAQFGAFRFSGVWIRRLLGIVLLVAALKLLADFLGS